MLLFDMPPPPFSDFPSSVAGFGLFLFFMAIAIFSFIRLESKVNVWFRLIIAAILFVIAVIGSFIVSFIVAQITYQRPHPGPPYSNSR